MSRSTINQEKALAWQGRIVDQARSGQSIAKYCNEHSLSKTGFSYWKRRLRSRGSGCFLPVKIAEPKTITCTRISLPNGVVVELGDDVAMAAMERFLKSLCGVHDAAT